jgi:hypothetical protein
MLPLANCLPSRCLSQTCPADHFAEWQSRPSRCHIECVFEQDSASHLVLALPSWPSRTQPNVIRMNRPLGAPPFNPRPQASDADFANPDRELFRSQLVRVGSFRCPVRHPHFQDAGTITSHLFVIPRTAVWIEHEGKPPFVGDPTIGACVTVKCTCSASRVAGANPDTTSRMSSGTTPNVARPDAGSGAGRT